MKWEETLKNELLNSLQLDYEHFYRIVGMHIKKGADMRNLWLLKHTGLGALIYSETDVWSSLIRFPDI